MLFKIPLGKTTICIDQLQLQINELRKRGYADDEDVTIKSWLHIYTQNNLWHKTFAWLTPDSKEQVERLEVSKRFNNLIKRMKDFKFQNKETV